MARLYKRTGTKILYWEACQINETTAIIYWGSVGKYEKFKEIKTVKVSTFENIIQYETSQKLREGYAEIKETNYSFLLIKYDVQNFAANEQVYIRHKLEEKMDIILDSKGLGYCDGGIIETDGAMKIGCAVIDFNIARSIIKKSLKNTEFSNYYKIVRVKS